MMMKSQIVHPNEKWALPKNSQAKIKYVPKVTQSDRCVKLQSPNPSLFGSGNVSLSKFWTHSLTHGPDPNTPFNNQHGVTGYINYTTRGCLWIFYLFILTSDNFHRNSLPIQFFWHLILSPQIYIKKKKKGRGKRKNLFSISLMEVSPNWWYRTDKNNFTVGKKVKNTILLLTRGGFENQVSRGEGEEINSKTFDVYCIKHQNYI